jgi:hypothetical protein
MHKTSFAVAAALLATSVSAAASEKDWDTASTIGAGALGLWAVGVPAATGDAKGALQSGLSVGAA